MNSFPSQIPTFPQSDHRKHTQKNIQETSTNKKSGIL